MNLFDVIERQARAQPHAPAVIDGETSMTFSELAAAAARAAALLSREGVSPGDVVAITTESSWQHLVLTLAIARLGAVSIFVAPHTPAQRRRQVMRDFGVKRVAELDADALRAPAGEPLPPSVAADELPWRICLTSGTTGKAKGIALHHARFVRTCALRGEAMKVAAGSRFLSRVVLNTAPVLIRAFCHLFAGGAVVFHRGDIAGVFDLIERLGVTHVYASPAVLRLWLERYPPGRPPLAGIVYFGVGGGRLPAALAREAMARITPNIHGSYGSTEAGAIARADPETLLRAPESAGQVVPWTEVQIVDESGRPLPAGQAGRLRVRGPEVATGYYRARDAGDDAGKGFRDGWFYPGDIARLAPDGLLYVEGRNDDVINLGGPKLNTRVLEDLLAEHATIAEAAVFGVPDPAAGTRVVAAVVARGRFDERELLLHLRRRGMSHPLRIVPVAALPRNDMGKVLKHRLAEQVRIKRRQPAA